MCCCIHRGWRSIAVVCALLANATGGDPQPRIYVYPLPNCSFDHFAEADIDGPTVLRFHPGRPPLLPIHERLVHGRYATSDPANATLFYIPAPFFLWDTSWTHSDRGLRCFHPLHEMSRMETFDENSVPRLLTGVSTIIGNDPRTVMVWIKSSRPILGFAVLVAMGLAVAGKSYMLGVRDGCPIVSACGINHVASCNASINDGVWHHIVATYEGGESSIYLDGQIISTQSSMKFDIDEGPVIFGGSDKQNTCGQDEAFHGQMRDLRIYNEKLSESLVRDCGFVPYAPLETSVDGHCFQSVRSFVEKSYWFERNRGWDHFVLFAGFDYPAAFNPIMPPLDEDYVLEKAWPAFGNFTILHFGARTERCLSEFKDPLAFAEYIGDENPSCVRRYFRTITIPPILRGEGLKCELVADAYRSRPTRIAYRGLAYNAMVERAAIRNAASSTDIILLQESHQVRLEFSNWTHELAAGGKCNRHLAFHGLCPWKTVGRAIMSAFGKARATAMKKRALELWATSDTCLVLPGDGGYELRLFSMINLGCIPVIVYARGLSRPKLPFVHSLPWHKFAIFWTLDSSSDSALSSTAFQLLNQLTHLDRRVIREKRTALLQYAHHLSWHEVPRFGRCGGNRKTSLDSVVEELTMRSSLPVDPPLMLTPELYNWKVPVASMDASSKEDVFGNNCPPGYPICSPFPDDPLRGDFCEGVLERYGWTCPLGCEKIDEAPHCVQAGVEQKPCRSSKCILPVQGLQKTWDAKGFQRKPHLAILTFSSHESLSALTRPSLERFCSQHPGRYHLLIEDEVLLDPRDWHPSWNKLALLRRALIMGGYDAVVWIDEDILITQSESDPIYEAIMNDLLALSKERLVLGSRDLYNEERSPLETGVYVLKKGRLTMKLIDRIFRIGRRKVFLDGMWRLPRKEGWYIKDAFAVYFQENGGEYFELLEHRKLQSIVQPGESYWHPMDFAAHFVAPDLKQKLSLIHGFIKLMAKHLA